MAAPPTARTSRAERLPRGRHGLTREEVTSTQRRRLMLAMAEAVAKHGYVATTVADVIKRAGVSRETYYQQFDSKLDGFLATFDAAADLLFRPIAASLDVEAGSGSVAPLERFDRVLGTYLGGLASEPAFARVFLVEVNAAGPEAIARRVERQATIACAVAALFDVQAEADRFACQALVAAISALVVPPLVADDLTALEALREPLVDLVRRHLGH